MLEPFDVVTYRSGFLEVVQVEHNLGVVAIFALPKNDAQQLASSCHSALFVKRLVVPLRDLSTQLARGKLGQRRCDFSVKGSELLRLVCEVLRLGAGCLNLADPRKNLVVLAPRGLQYTLVY